MRSGIPRGFRRAAHCVPGLMSTHGTRFGRVNRMRNSWTGKIGILIMIAVLMLCVTVTAAAAAEVMVKKVDIADGVTLEGAMLQIVDGEGNPVDVWISTAEAHETAGLTAGEEYTLRELEAPEGYVTAADTAFTVDIYGNVLIDGVAVEDGVILVGNKKTIVRVIKVDAETWDALEGAVLRLTDSEGNVIEEWTSVKEPHTIEGLKIGEEYTLREVTAPEDYAGAADTVFTLDGDTVIVYDGTLMMDEEGVYVLVVKDEKEDAGEWTEATVVKVWDDGDNKDGTRPATLLLTLSNGTEPVATVLLVEEGGWTMTVPGLPKYQDGTLVTYTWTEDESELPVGYSLSSIAVNGTVTTLTNRYEATTDVTVVKEWDDGDNQDGLRPERLLMILRDGDDIVGRALLSDENGWTETLEGLPKYRDGAVIEYTWTEDQLPEGYMAETEADGTVTTITNTHDPETVRMLVRKVWEDDDNHSGARPGSLKVTLSNGTETVATVTLDEGSGWTASVEGLPKYADGKEIEYTWTEEELPWYYQLTDVKVEEVHSLVSTLEGKLTTLTNTLRTGGLRVTKRATGESTDTGFEFTITLNLEGKAVGFWYTVIGADGVPVGPTEAVDTAVVILKNGETVSVAGVPEGTEYVITETENGRYAVTVDGVRTNSVTGTVGRDGASNGLIFINSLRTRDITVTKRWVGGRPGNDSIIPHLTLYADGKEVKDAVFTRNGDSYTVSGLPVCDKDGNEIRYTVKESTISGYYAPSYSSAEGKPQNAAEDGSTITNEKVPYVPSQEIKAKKIWTGVAEDEKLPDVTVDVYRLNADGTSTWVKKVTWSAQKIKNHGGYIYAYNLNLNGTYYMVEQVPAGYTVRYTNIGDRAGETDRAYNNGTIENHKIPTTGDARPAGIWALAAGVSAVGIMLVLAGEKRRRKNA